MRTPAVYGSRTAYLFFFFRQRRRWIRKCSRRKDRLARNHAHFFFGGKRCGRPDRGGSKSAEIVSPRRFFFSAERNVYTRHKGECGTWVLGRPVTTEKHLLSSSITDAIDDASGGRTQKLNLLSCSAVRQGPNKHKARGRRRRVAALYYVLCKSSI